jgi:hypothetical protein
MIYPQTKFYILSFNPSSGDANELGSLYKSAVCVLFFIYLLGLHETTVKNVMCFYIYIVLQKIIGP